MRIGIGYLTATLGAAAAAIALVAAPTAAATTPEPAPRAAPPVMCRKRRGDSLPVTRQCPDQRRPSPCSFLSLRRRRLSALTPLCGLMSLLTKQIRRGTRRFQLAEVLIGASGDASVQRPVAQVQAITCTEL